MHTDNRASGAERYDRAMKTLRRAAAWCLDLVFPKHCLGCGAEGCYLCPACYAGLRSAAPTCPVCGRRNFDGILCPPCAETTGLRRFLAPFSYREPLVRGLIHTYKYGGVRELAPLFAAEIADFLARCAVRPHASAVLVPIPLHRGRERRRGFNQSSLLAHELAKRLGCAVSPAIVRRRATTSQTEMASFAERRANVAEAFRIANASAIAGRTAILVDDVSTSGATLAEAAACLRAAGAQTVWAIAVAKG